MAETLNPGPYEFPADPADYKVEAITSYLTGDQVTPDQWDAILKAEAEGKARTQILALADSTPPAGPSPSTTSAPNSDPQPGTTEPGGVPAEQPPANPDEQPTPGEQPAGTPTQDGQPDQGDTESAVPAENPELELQRSSKPVWYTETQGPCPDDKRDLYTVVEPQTVGVG